MSSLVIIRDIESLDRLRIAISTFCEESENYIQWIDLTVFTRLENLKTLESQFCGVIESAQEDLRIVEEALYDCESGYEKNEGGNSSYSDCDIERAKVNESRDRLRLAEESYYSYKREIRNLEKTIDDYQRHKVKYRTLIHFEKEAATNSLKQLINGAEDYLSVSYLFHNSVANGYGMTNKNSKVNPTIIHATGTRVEEIIVMSSFSFLGLSGSLFSISNNSNNGMVTTTYTENGTETICSELRIERSDVGDVGKIISVNVPSSLQSQRIGKYIVNNMEAICRANDCKEISGWAITANVSFYQGMDYKTRHEIKEIGAEVFKPLESFFFSSQRKAKAEFEYLKDIDFTKNNNLGKQEVNPLNIISPVEMNDEKFWQQHGENQYRYIDLIDKYARCCEELKSGKTLDQIRKEDSWVANAYNVFHGSEPIKLLKSGDNYRLDSNGRHRVAAAQMYYLNTGKIINLPCEVIERIL